MLQFFDAHVRVDSLVREVLENFAYFNVKVLLVAAHAPRGFEQTEDLLFALGEGIENARTVGSGCRTGSLGSAGLARLRDRAAESGLDLPDVAQSLFVELEAIEQA